MLNRLELGQRLPRRQLHQMFGGRQQGGISPSREAPVVMFFTDPARGHQHGYYDGWDAEGLYNYVGEGQKGDQQMVQGNKAIYRHLVDKRTLEGFKADGTNVTYMGEFVYVDHFRRDAHESGDESTIRQVIVFRLKPTAGVPVELPSTPVTVTDVPVVEEVGVEQMHTESAFVAPRQAPYEMQRIEAALVDRYRAHLQRLGHRVQRLKIVPPGEGAPLYSDLWDRSTSELVEAKAGVTREHVRHAVGQLLDYGRFVPDATRVLLVPERPRSDLIAFLQSVGVGIVYPMGTAWERVEPSADVLLQSSR